ncbi:MAG: amidohydrolase family protein [Gemmatimonadetes bacterium]|nr:amidohydrolase family protein [Gemmatimonadota bacterium]
MRRLSSIVALSLWFAAPALAPIPVAAQASDEWDVTKPRGRTREIDFTVSQGTWTQVDLSSDGQWIVFDLLSQIYRVRAAGGQAEPLTENSGIALNFNPRFSPDGKSIAFISDRKGQNNLWVMDADGGNPRQVADDQQAQFRSPVWTADGQFIVVLKTVGFAGRSLVMYHRDGGTGVDLVKGEMGRMPSRPTTSPDGRYLYYDVYTARPTGFWGQEDVLKGTIQIHRYDFKTGSITPITSGESAQQDRSTSGGAFAAEASPDGRSLAFMRKVPGGTLVYKGQRFGPRAALWIRDLRLGTERLLMDPVEMDLSEESIPINGTYPGYRWAADGRSIVLHQGGKIRRVEVASGQVSTIPFTARVKRTISEQVWVKNQVSDGPFDVRFIRWASTSPDGRTVAFQALGRIYTMALPSGAPRRLTPASFGPMEFQPAWSPDGRWIAFATVDDRNSGALWRVQASGGNPERLTSEPGEYLNPSWNTDGTEIVAARGSGATSRGSSVSRNGYFDLVRLPAGGGAETDIVQVVTAGGQFGPASAELRPSVGSNGRVYYAVGKVFGPGDGLQPLMGVEIASVRLDGTDRKVHANVRNADDARVSPDGRWVAFNQGNNVYLAPLPAGGSGDQTPMIAKAGGAFNATPLTTEGGLYPTWRSGTVVDFGSANRVFSHDVVAKRTDTVTVKLTSPRAIPSGSIALTGARIVTLDNKRVIPRGTVVVRAGRISCVGSCSTAGVDRVVNASGKTIIPGWVDMHAHHHREHLGMMPRHNFESAIYLAYGITTTSDPSTTSTAAFPTAEMIEAGEMVGPRVFSVAEALTNGDSPGTNDVTSRDIAVKEVKRRMSWGAMLLKQYLQPTRRQRQWAVDAAREAGLQVTAEGSMDLNHKVSMAMDGHTGFEHVTVQSPIYQDFVQFMGKTRSVYSHTPLVSGFGAWNEEYFWQESPIWLDSKQQRWVPWRQLIPHTRRFIQRPETDYSKDILAQQIAEIVAAGGYTAVGSHGQQPGLGSHWDVWMAAKATGNMTALEIASVHGATFLGMADDFGSITVGKLGDLMILNRNPLENIRATADIQYVMKAGVLYDAMSLDEVWPNPRKFGDYYWVVPEMYRVDEKPVGAWDR